MQVDFARPGADLSAYRVLLVPSMFALDDAAVRSVEEFVAGGGHVVVWPFTGIADENLHVVTGGYPGRLRDLVGLRVEHLAPLAPGRGRDPGRRFHRLGVVRARASRPTPRCSAGITAATSTVSRR